MECTDWEEIWPPVPLYQNTTIIQQPVGEFSCSCIIQVNLETLVDRYTEQAIQFMEGAVNRSQPFFLYMAYDEVHVPLFASPKFQNTSLRGLFGDAVAEMDNRLDGTHHKLRWNPLRFNVDFIPICEVLKRCSIGVIVNKLQQLGIQDNTFVFFTSDNGPWLEQLINSGSAGLFRGGKGSTWEGGMREPAIAYWPGKIAPGTVNMDIASVKTATACLTMSDDGPICYCTRISKCSCSFWSIHWW